MRLTPDVLALGSVACWLVLVFSAMRYATWLARHVVTEREVAPEQILLAIETMQRADLVIQQLAERRSTTAAPWAANRTAAAIMAGIRADNAWGRLPVLADALEDAGCDDVGLLHGLRHESAVAREWAERNL